MNGPEAVKILRNNLKFRHAIIGTYVAIFCLVWVWWKYLTSCCYSVGVTGNALPADIALFTSSGADQVLLKPLNKAQFLAASISFIDRRV